MKFFLAIVSQICNDNEEGKGENKKRKIVRWWTKKTSIEKSITILAFIVLITTIQVLALSVRLNEVISLLLQTVQVMQ